MLTLLHSCYLYSPVMLAAATAFTVVRCSFMTGCFWEYRFAFSAALRSYNENNAGFPMGTVCLFRRQALELVGGWAPWCVTEDSELGMRFNAAGAAVPHVPVTRAHDHDRQRGRLSAPRDRCAVPCTSAPQWPHCWPTAASRPGRRRPQSRHRQLLLRASEGSGRRSPTAAGACHSYRCLVWR